mgnify:CR=1 FL=1
MTGVQTCALPISSGSDPRWGGKPEIDNLEYPQVKESGIFIKMIQEGIKERGIPKLKEIGAGFDMPNFDKGAIVKEIEEFLKD